MARVCTHIEQMSPSVPGAAASGRTKQTPSGRILDVRACALVSATDLQHFCFRAGQRRWLRIGNHGVCLIADNVPNCVLSVSSCSCKVVGRGALVSKTNQNAESLENLPQCGIRYDT